MQVKGTHFAKLSITVPLNRYFPYFRPLNIFTISSKKTKSRFTVTFLCFIINTFHKKIYDTTIIPNMTVSVPVWFRTECGILPFTKKLSFFLTITVSLFKRLFASPCTTIKRWLCLWVLFYRTASIAWKIGYGTIHDLTGFYKQFLAWKFICFDGVIKSFISISLILIKP